MLCVSCIYLNRHSSKLHQNVVCNTVQYDTCLSFCEWSTACYWMNNLIWLFTCSTTVLEFQTSNLISTVISNTRLSHTVVHFNIHNHINANFTFSLSRSLCLSLCMFVFNWTTDRAGLTSMPIMPWHGAPRFRGPPWAARIFFNI